MELSKKQREVITLLYEKNTFITRLKGLRNSCYLHGDLSFRISMATLFKLDDLNLIEEKNSQWNTSDYFLTELGWAMCIEALNKQKI